MPASPLRAPCPPPAAARAWRGLARLLPLATALLLAACPLQQGPTPATAGPPSAQEDTARLAQWPWAPQASPTRVGRWEGGPERSSAKLPSGITLYYRVQALGEQRFGVTLRLEDAQGPDASLQVYGLDGAALMAPATSAWRLAAGQAAQLELTWRGQARDSYLQVLTRQGGRVTARAILLPGTDTAARPSNARTDASGEPVISMPSTR